MKEPKIVEHVKNFFGLFGRLVEACEKQSYLLQKSIEFQQIQTKFAIERHEGIVRLEKLAELTHTLSIFRELTHLVEKQEIFKFALIAKKDYNDFANRLRYDIIEVLGLSKDSFCFLDYDEIANEDYLNSLVEKRNNKKEENE